MANRDPGQGDEGGSGYIENRLQPARDVAEHQPADLRLDHLGEVPEKPSSTVAQRAQIPPSGPISSRGRPLAAARRSRPPVGFSTQIGVRRGQALSSVLRAGRRPGPSKLPRAVRSRRLRGWPPAARRGLGPRRDAVWIFSSTLSRQGASVSIEAEIDSTARLTASCIRACSSWPTSCIRLAASSCSRMAFWVTVLLAESAWVMAISYCSLSPLRLDSAACSLSATDWAAVGPLGLAGGVAGVLGRFGPEQSLLGGLPSLADILGRILDLGLDLGAVGDDLGRLIAKLLIAPPWPR